MTAPIPMQTLDLRTTKCPLNFVKTKLALEKLVSGDILEIWIATESQSTLNIPKSIAQEGHAIVFSDDHAGFANQSVQRLFIQKK